MSNGCITSTFKSGVTETARVNGFDVIQTTATGTTVANTGTSITVGAGESGTAYYGDISELVIYAGVDRSGSRHLIERHMNTYYSAFTYETKNLYVSKWYDQSGNGKHLTNISMYHPLIVNNGTIYTSFGKPSIYFSTTKNPVNFLKVNFPVNTLSTLSIISVSKLVSGGSVLLFDDLSWGGIWQRVYSTSIAYRFGIGVTTQSLGGSVTNTGGSIFSTYKNGNQEIARVNGLDRITYTSSKTTIANTGGVMKIGGDDGYTGNISEIIFYNSNKINDRVDIETNLNIYYNVYKNSSYLKTWYDQSGGGRHAQQVTAAYQPLLVSSGTLITDGGIPSIKFSSSYFLSYGSTLPIGSTFSVFSVLRKVTHVNNVGYFTFMPSSGNDYATGGGRTFTHGPSLNLFRIEASGMDLYYSTPANQRFAFSSVYSGTTMSSRVNNSDLVNTVHATTINSNGLLLGARYTNSSVNSFSDSSMNEFILYGTNQNSNRVGIENNINTYYSVWNNIVTSGLVLHLDAGRTASYPGTGLTWNDLSGLSNNATLINGPIWNSNNSGTILFDGINDYSTLNSSTSINSSSEFTFSIWIKSSDIASEQMIISNANTELTKGWNIEIYQSKFLLQCYPSAGFTQATTTLSSNVWYNLVVTYSGGNQVFYNNGTQNGTVTRTFDPSTSQVVIGKWLALPLFLKSNVSQILFYNRALSATEILQNFNQTRSRFGV